ncbi:MAG: hypothetical protein ACM3SU_16280 [Acidobacteriota bacterium]
MREAEPLADEPPSSRRTTALLLAVSALSLLPRLWLSLTSTLSHNGAWHVFTCRNFAREFRGIAHPPLFLLLLKACDAASRSLLSYRLVPMLAGAGSVFLAGRILQRLRCLPATCIIGALAVALSTTMIALSNQVEGYALCVLFVLAAFFFYLDLARPDRVPPVRSRIGFAAFASLALLTEYLAGLFLVACALAPLAGAALRRGYRREWKSALPRRLAADVLTLLPPLLVGGGLYALFARVWVRRLAGPASGLTTLYFRPAAESAVGFLARTLGSTWNLVSPLPLENFGAGALAVFLLLVVALPAAREGERRPSAARLLPALVLVILIVVGAVLGLLRRYPFGGTPRHQVLILLFALLAAFVALDSFLSATRGTGRAALAVLCAAAIGANVVANRDRLRRFGRDEPLNVQAGTYARELTRVRTVHLDLMNFIGLFMDYYPWDCRFAGRISQSPPIERYELSREGRRLTVIAHRGIWMMDFRAAALYRELRTTMPAGACETAFSIDRNLFRAPRTARPQGERRELEQRIPALASAADLQTRSLTIDDDLVKAGVCCRP